MSDFQKANYENSFIDLLNEDKPVRVCLMSHNANWPLVKRYIRDYANCEISIFGSSTSYLRFNEKTKIDFDMITLFGNCSYAELELNIMKKIANIISDRYHKRVTVGYSYMKCNQETHITSTEITIFSIKENIETSVTLQINDKYFSVVDFLDCVTGVHSKIENKFVAKLI
jgi:hypothetical protein